MVAGDKTVDTNLLAIAVLPRDLSLKARAKYCYLVSSPITMGNYYNCQQCQLALHNSL